MTNYPKDSRGKIVPATVQKKEISALKRAVWNIGANIGLLGGIWFFISAVFMTISDFLYSENPRGSWLFLAVLPLWVIGAYCYDKFEDAD
jgi:hypothetical protein